MGLFGSIGKVFGGALKIAGKVAGVASSIAPIPGLGFAGKIAQGAGKLVAGGQRVQRYVGGVMPGGVGVNVMPPPPAISVATMLRDIKRSTTGNILLPPREARTGAPGSGRATAAPVVGTDAYYGDPDAPAPRKRRRKKRRATTARRRRVTRKRASSRRTSRRRGRRRKLSRAQLRAGFGGRRRMRR